APPTDDPLIDRSDLLPPALVNPQATFQAGLRTAPRIALELRCESPWVDGPPRCAGKTSVSFMQFSRGAAAQAGKIHLQTPPSHGEQVDRPECDVSQKSLRRAFHGPHVRQPPSKLQHLLGCRPPQRFIRVKVAFVPTPRNHIG